MTVNPIAMAARVVVFGGRVHQMEVLPAPRRRWSGISWVAYMRAGGRLLREHHQ